MKLIIWPVDLKIKMDKRIQAQRYSLTVTIC